jgi:hypothetical protein
VEIAAAEAMAAAGIVPAEAARELRDKAPFNIARIDEIEKTDAARRDSRSRLPVGRESSGRRPVAALRPDVVDVVDTAQALQMVEACDLILKNMTALGEAIKTRAEEHKHTPMIGRTHGVHAEVMTFGLKLTLWYAEWLRDIERVRPRPRDDSRRQDLRRRRHVRAPRSLDRGRCLQAPWLDAGADLVAGHSARSPRRASHHAGDHRGIA